LVLNISWVEGKKEGRGGFCLECGVGKMLEEKKEEEGFCLEFGV